MMQRTQKGLTLLEVLVVLVIVSLVATMMMQGFGYTMGMYQRVVNTQRDGYKQVMAYKWLRQTLSATAPPRDYDVYFKADAQGLVATSFHPLFRAAEGKTVIGWRVESTAVGWALIYTEAEQDFQVLQGDDGLASFEYLDAQDSWRDSWPPEEVEPRRIPEAVRLMVGEDNYTAVINTRKTAEVGFDEVLYGRD